MAICKDCLHAEVCRYYTNELAKANGIPLKVEEIEGLLECGDCEHFKGRSRFVELPCKIGEKIYDPVRGQISEYKVVSFGVNEYGLYLNLRCIQGLCRHDMIRPEWIGTTVFFTPEEAEQALKERKKDE